MCCWWLAAFLLVLIVERSTVVAALGLVPVAEALRSAPIVALDQLMLARSGGRPVRPLAAAGAPLAACLTDLTRADLPALG
jgi:hypothetical protein